MIISKSRANAKASTGKRSKNTKKAKVLELEEYLHKRDFSAACVLLEFRCHSEGRQPKTLEWLAYCYFHNREHDRALKIYKELLNAVDPDPIYRVYAAACSYYMGLYEEAELEAQKGPDVPLRTRLLFHLSHKLGNEDKLMEYHQKLTETTEDQLTLASIHYLRSHFQEATDIYKRLLLENRDFLALNVYVALCYSKLDYYDVSLEILSVHLQTCPDSAFSLNLKACNHFRLYNGKAAEAELKPLKDLTDSECGDNELIRHNLVVFRNGENALTVLPRMVDMIPEARLNLVIYHLRNNDINEAFELVKDLKPNTPQEYILKGVVYATLGQSTGSAENLKTAQQYFQLVGASASECDTIPGRQCMASCFFLLKQFEDVLIYLKSIKSYFPSDDDFNWNFGLAKAEVGDFREAEEALTAISNERYRIDPVYVNWLARCYIMNGKPGLAWELYLRMETSTASYNLLQLIANDCYKMGHFLYSAKAFDVLERLDPDPEYWEGKCGACVGVFQAVIAKKESPNSLSQVIAMLRKKPSPQVEAITRAIRKWCGEQGIPDPAISSGF
uniref:Tetratricopeptide repeat protein 26 n=1 Tax=Tetraselmis sp. GSL018 TaxID=582737 RepID=A0A061QZQ4_9CHLO|eukprot:CAMPEP_0177605280 /NCGR_PEP_ID=MMETSP0419_2-20121207/16610_1 /TAXON_ID=582737 /ORGANISM="Tetraselmis sp., Strain GSL018" /LENGTH=559 /DNA_ID=CAMNT_0019099405 /DNA_START=5 /DNA_END=1687 /DNA_ORIENTATION=+